MESDVPELAIELDNVESLFVDDSSEVGGDVPDPDARNSTAGREPAQTEETEVDLGQLSETLLAILDAPAAALPEADESRSMDIDPDSAWPSEIDLTYLSQLSRFIDPLATLEAPYGQDADDEGPATTVVPAEQPQAALPAPRRRYRARGLPRTTVHTPRLEELGLLVPLRELLSDLPLAVRLDYLKEVEALFEWAAHAEDLRGLDWLTASAEERDQAIRRYRQDSMNAGVRAGRRGARALFKRLDGNPDVRIPPSKQHLFPVWLEPLLDVPAEVQLKTLLQYLRSAEKLVAFAPFDWPNSSRDERQVAIAAYASSPNVDMPEHIVNAAAQFWLRHLDDREVPPPPGTSFLPPRSQSPSEGSPAARTNVDLLTAFRAALAHANWSDRCQEEYPRLVTHLLDWARSHRHFEGNDWLKSERNAILEQYRETLPPNRRTLISSPAHMFFSVVDGYILDSPHGGRPRQADPNWLETLKVNLTAKTASGRNKDARIVLGLIKWADQDPVFGPVNWGNMSRDERENVYAKYRTTLSESRAKLADRLVGIWFGLLDRGLAVPPPPIAADPHAPPSPDVQQVGLLISNLAREESNRPLRRSSQLADDAQRAASTVQTVRYRRRRMPPDAAETSHEFEPPPRRARPN